MQDATPANLETLTTADGKPLKESIRKSERRARRSDLRILSLRGLPSAVVSVSRLAGVASCMSPLVF